MHGEEFIGAAEDGNEVVFECAYGSFSGVASMYVGWRELVRNIVLLLEKGFDGLGCFIVHSVYL